VVPDLKIEKSLVAAFVVPRKRSRHKSLLDSRKGRDKLRRSLAHSPDWDPRFMRKKPPDCYVLSENDRDDAKRMDLMEALTGSIGYGMETVISCVPGQLAFTRVKDQGCAIF